MCTCFWYTFQTGRSVSWHYSKCPERIPFSDGSRAPPLDNSFPTRALGGVPTVISPEKKTLDWIGWPWRDHPQWLVDHPSLVKPDHQQNKDQKTRPDEEKKRPLTLKTEYLTKKRIKLTNSVTARQTAKINLIYYIQKPRFQVNFNYRSSPNRSFSF